MLGAIRSFDLVTARFAFESTGNIAKDVVFDLRIDASQENESVPDACREVALRQVHGDRDSP